jgi:hypothetical protein
MTQSTTYPEQRSNRAVVWMSAAVFLSGLAWLGHRLVFAQFQNYDDEGYLLVTVQQFLRGRAVYDEVYTQYGPAYYLWQQVLHAVIGIPVTHDATRVITVVIWLACAVLIGTLVWMLTKRLLLTVIATAFAFLHLSQLTFEPGHPQELCLLSILGALTVTTWRLVEKRHVGSAVSMGVWVLAAITALTKINVGALFAAALTLGLVTGLRRSRWQTVVERIVLAATMAAPLVLMRSDLLRDDIAAYVVVVWCGLLAAFISGSGDSADQGVVTVWGLAAGLSAFAIACAVIVALIVYEGTSLRSLLEGLFVAPLLLSKVFWAPLPVSLLIAVASPVTLCAAWCWQRGIIVRQRLIAVVALASGLLIVLLSSTKSYQPLFAGGPLLAWLTLSQRPLTEEHRAARRMLVFAAILLVLQAYPMPDGTQIVLGTVLFVPLAMVMIAGAQWTLAPDERGQHVQASFVRRASLAALGLAGAINIGLQAERLYAHGIPLQLPGTRSVRTTPRDAATYWWLTVNLRDNCDRFIAAPGVNSLYFWTNIEPVSTLNATLWPLLFDADQQRRVLAAAMPTDRLCVAWAMRRMATLTSARDVAARPLFAWLLQEFEPRARVGDWELRMRREQNPTVVYGGRWVDGAVAIELPSMGHEVVARMAVVDLDNDRTLGDSARAELVVLDEQGARMHVDTGIDVSRRRRLVVRLADAERLSSNDQSVAIRLWARSDRSLAIVPIVADALLERSSATSQPQH